MTPKIMHLHRVGHGKIISVYHHLCSAQYVPETNPNITAEKAAEHNQRVHSTFNAPQEKQRLRESIEMNEELLDSLENLKIKKARQLCNMGLLEIRCAWGSAQEASTLATLCNVLEDKTLFECGLLEADVDTLHNLYGFLPESLPPLGATPDGIMLHRAIVKDCEASKTFHSLEDCEVVEVKNSCPFSISAKAGKKVRFSVRDKGPRERCDVSYVPQLQFHMLCSGARSALLVSRSATKGIRIFRMHRDDEYIKLMLGVLNILWQSYVLPRKVPPKNAFSNLRIHRKLLLKTRELAASASIECEISPADAMVSGADARFFLDDNDSC